MNPTVTSMVLGYAIGTTLWGLMTRKYLEIVPRALIGCLIILVTSAALGDLR